MIKYIQTMKNNKQLALIYCRVSSERQKNEGHGLDSQELRCRQFAEQNNYEVIKTFKDSFSGGGDFMKRPAMKELLDYVDSKPHEKFVVIFDDLKRFARDTVFHIKLRQEFNARDLRPICLNFNFEDSAEGQFIETIMAAQGELERKQNKRQVIQKMKARLEQGYWTFGSVLGYKQVKTPEHGKLLVPFEPEASVIKETLIGYAEGRFPDKKDVADFLVSKNFRNKKYIGYQTVDRILTNSIYAGCIEYQQWEVPRKRGWHEALVDLETWEIIQARLQGKQIKRIRNDTNPDFPLRNFLLCPECKKPLTASWSTGRKNKYPYYRCNQKLCSLSSKSINSEKVHSDFKIFLERISPDEDMIELTRAIANDVWNSKMKELEKEKIKIENKGIEIQKQIDSFMDKMMNARSLEMERAFEERVEALLKEKEKLRIDNYRKISENIDFGTALDSILEYVKKPSNKWLESGLEDKRTIFKMVFEDNIEYDRKFGFGTAKLSPIFNVFMEFEHTNSLDVEMGGIEPPCT
jgi:site-specific DNA recombinase